MDDNVNLTVRGREYSTPFRKTRLKKYFGTWISTGITILDFEYGISNVRCTFLYPTAYNTINIYGT